MSKIITRGDFIDAIEKNGWPQRTGSFFFRKKNPEGVVSPYLGFSGIDPSRVVGACAVGQGLLNLHIYDTSFRGISRANSQFIQRLIRLNDEYKYPIHKIVEWARSFSKVDLNTPLYDETEGTWL